MGNIQYIHIADYTGGPMQSRHDVEVVPRSGVLGDPYASRAGYWQDSRVSRDLTLIEAEAIALLADLGIELAPGETRRNLTTHDVNLPDLIDQVFRIGDVIARGTSRVDGAIFTSGGPWHWQGGRPQFSVIQVAANSREGLPARGFLQALAGSPMYCTDRLGTAELVAASDGFALAD